MGSLVEVSQVEMVYPSPPLVRAFNVEGPVQGSLAEAAGFELRGWVVGATRPALGIEVSVDGRVVRRSPLAPYDRPDLGADFPDLPWAAGSAFHTRVLALGRAPQASIALSAMFPGGHRTPLATCLGTRLWRTRAETPAVSVVIPCFNQAHFLVDAIRSVQAQTTPSCEIVVIDDGSSDNTSEIAQQLGVTCHRQNNAGLARARNEGLRRTRGEFVVFLDADDCLLPHAIDTALELFRANPAAAAVFGQYTMIDALGRPGPDFIGRAPRNDVFLELLAGYSPATPGTGMFRREVFEHVTPFDPAVNAAADFDLMLRVARDFTVVMHDEPVIEYRQHASSMSRDVVRMLNEVMKVQRSKSQKLTEGERIALRSGRRHMIDHYLPAILDQFAAAVRSRHWWEAARTATCITRYRPSAMYTAVASLDAR